MSNEPDEVPTLITKIGVFANIPTELLADQVIPSDYTFAMPLPRTKEEREAYEAKRQADLDAKMQEAMQDYSETFGTLALNPVAFAVLSIHKPSPAYDRVDCEHCLTGVNDVEGQPWPCDTYTALKEAS